ncbi:MULTISPECIES: GNAT family N-acetyltransferase [Hymenobacter]|uniref:GNAT family N-acetyltransferase n=2 Tax=Hymenobacter TaxID=89966 RepID=A0ABS6X4F3_9BACT|nr:MULTISPECIES: GNAT family N-acetyltransferase [Hymenobacter]MBO3270623.1 GNAT family N-acetyltransferase [Hymenobacter defluvii]MBW3130715.1 GNAT family N-acetyltransferase [Hymenobacter profundi]QNE39990.1 GNAT family N-acetyltransferase [Hymenobacter sp. NBH84]
MKLNWTLKPYPTLSLEELYALLRLRSEVFVVEQTCAFQDIDGQDQTALHLLGRTETGELAAYTRLFDAGDCYAQVSIGRVVVSPAYRRSGLGQELMHQSINACERAFGPQPIKIGAQLYLKAFYESFGFAQQGDVYLEDGIEHIYMLRP